MPKRLVDFKDQYDGDEEVAQVLLDHHNHARQKYLLRIWRCYQEKSKPETKPSYQPSPVKVLKKAHSGLDL